MSIITKISSQKRVSDRVNVYLDGEFAFSLSQEVLLDSGLRQGDELSDDRLREILDKDMQSRVFSKVLDFIAYQLRTEREIKDKIRALLLKDIPDQDLHGDLENRVLERVRKTGLIDDLSYAKSYVAGRLLAKSVPGKFKVREYLIKKGIGREDIEEALEGYGQESEVEGARAAATRKLKTLKAGKPQEIRAKLWRFLAARGYSSDTIAEAVKAVVDTNSDID